LAAKTLASLKKSQPDRDVDVVIESGLAAEGDIRLLRIVMENLLGNAWKFSGRTANAKIEVGRARNAELGTRNMTKAELGNRNAG
jgi:signal transduction histidine kinase